MLEVNGVGSASQLFGLIGGVSLFLFSCSCPVGRSSGDGVLGMQENEMRSYSSEHSERDGGASINAALNNTADDDHDRIANGVDKCPARPETYNGYLDTDGCP